MPSAVSRCQRMLAGKLGADLMDFQQRLEKSELDTSGHIEKHIYYWEPKSLRIRAINWWHVFASVYRHHVYTSAIVAGVSLIVWQVWNGFFKPDRLLEMASDPHVLEVVLVAAIIAAYISKWKPPVYCMENVIFVPPESWQVTQNELMSMMKAQGCFTEGSVDFLQKVLDKSATGESTHWPPGILPSRDGETKAQCTMEAARDEAKVVVCSLVKEVLKRSGVKPKEIDFLVINCSLFCPTPSLCAIVCNEFGLRQDVRSYNLGGMGCSANVISVDLAKQLLENSPGSRALVISTENITQNLYKGNEKSMLLQNTLFRCGGCAQLLSSRRSDALYAKYKLLYTIRAQISDDNSYNCVFQKEDGEGNSGVALSKDIVSVAGRAMKQNFIQLGPYVLPIREQAWVVFNLCWIQAVAFAKKMGVPGSKEWTAPPGYTPNFGKGIDHFCIHAGGRAVIEGVQKNLKLSERQVQPSFQTLREWGNTSSSSIWYETDWIERYGDIRAGHRVLQIAFGSGFKCNSAVWVALNIDHGKRGVAAKKEGSS